MEAREQRNYKRVRTLINLANKVLVIVLRDRFPSSSCYARILKDNKKKLERIGRHDQLMKILYPLNDDYRGDFSELDITNVCTLLRNIGNLASAAEWKKTPVDTDRSITANVIRIKSIRDEIFHHSYDRYNAMRNEEFDACWKELRQCIVELGGNGYIKEIDEILHSDLEMGTIVRQFHIIKINFRSLHCFCICFQRYKSKSKFYYSAILVIPFVLLNPARPTISVFRFYIPFQIGYSQDIKVNTLSNNGKNVSYKYSFNLTLRKTSLESINH